MMQVLRVLRFRWIGCQVISIWVLLLAACTPPTPVPDPVDAPTVVLPSLTSLEPPVQIATLTTPTAAPSPVAVMLSPTPAPLDFYETAQLLQSRIESHFAQPGWIFTRSELIRHTGTSPKSFMSNGQPEPDHYVEETWYQFLSGGSVERMILLKKTDDGQDIETLIYANGTMWYSLLDETRGQPTITLDRLGSDSLRNAIEFADENEHVVTLFEAEGREIVRISVLDEAPGPITMDGFEQKVTAIYTENDYDYLEGWLIRVEHQVILEDGTRQRTLMMSIDVQAGPDLTPPEEILAQMEE